ncbi:MAG TPA: ABC transporter permease [Rhodobacteraceae bacterium]|nr:ABC transporter permease [Paracoccaceae bacterium]
MSDLKSTGPQTADAPTPEDALHEVAGLEEKNGKSGGPVLAADGTPLKHSLARALRLQKLRALGLIAPLLIFVLVAFIAPIADMLFRAVENQIVSNTLPRTVQALGAWDEDASEVPPEEVYEALYYDFFIAAEARRHTRLGQRLNYENAGMSSLFRGSGRDVDDFREADVEAIQDLDDKWEDPAFWTAMMAGQGGEALIEDRRAAFMALADLDERGVFGDLQCAVSGLFGGACDPAPEDIALNFSISSEIIDLLPLTAMAYADFGVFTVLEDGDVVTEEEPWEAVLVALASDLRALTPEDLAAYEGAARDDLIAAKAAVDQIDPESFAALFTAADEDWGTRSPWLTIATYAPDYTSGYFLNAVDMQKGLDGPEARPENQQIYMMLFQRTLFMSLVITGSCILLGYPVAWLLANLPMRTANLLMILVLLPFWTSLLVRTSAWKVMLQQQGVINDTLVWLGLVDDASRLVMINNQFGTIVAMTHILLPFMILPLYSVMQTIPPSYLRAAKSLGATNWTAFWRVYFPQSVPGIGAGSILVFILSIGYYITPEIVGGTTGTFISNRIAYHISSSLNWGLAAALGSILLAVVLILYWAYDKIVGIDNVKLGG